MSVVTISALVQAPDGLCRAGVSKSGDILLVVYLKTENIGHIKTEIKDRGGIF